ncbi:MAG TPA: 50S ribosomal protein L11 methyltransferase [Burkholderiales bacterium]|nr:50S ribosomal protein L11 methyltransferase [Burkholderiales bacterium]
MVAGEGAARDRRPAAALNVVPTLAAALLVALAAHAQDPEVRAPFITTPEDVVERMLALAGTGPADHVVDLGSGDGRIVIAAAKLHGARGLGVDIDAKLVEISRDNARRAGVANLVEFEERDVLLTDLSRATVVTIYLLPSLIDRLQPKLLDELRPGARIVSHAFAMKGWKPDRVEKVWLRSPYLRQGDESTIFLWIVPAQARGSWRGGEWSLRVQQNFQEIEIEASAGGRTVPVTEARLEGTAISFSAPGFSFRGQVGPTTIAGEMTRSGRTSPLSFSKER